MSAFATLKFIVHHPLNRRRPIAALLRFARWQLGSRMLQEAVAMPFVGQTRLLVKPGMTGATGNVYCGLHEFEDMAFVLHALRPNDLFFDIGANVGSYTVLAAGACEARVLAVEPVPSTYRSLMDNVLLNGLADRVNAHNVALGSSPGEVRFSTGLDTMNHVLSSQETQDGIALKVRTLDALAEEAAPVVMKIDVEGYETEVLRGGERVLGSQSLLAVVMELNGSGSRYGYDETILHSRMLDLGFVPCRYEPIARKLSPAHGNNRPGNTLYVRQPELMQERLREAPLRSVTGQHNL